MFQVSIKNRKMVQSSNCLLLHLVLWHFTFSICEAAHPFMVHLAIF